MYICPELEQRNDLRQELALLYLQLIVKLFWAVELRRIDIFTEVEVMSHYSTSTQLGTLGGLYHIFEYIINHEISRLVFDPFQPKVDDSSFAARTADWKYFYGNIEEDITPGMPEPLCKSAHKTFFF